MEADFWHNRWEANKIAFHEGKPNAFLISHFDTLAIPEAGRVFVPLCGKTSDIAWLLAQGYHVIGAELSALAIDQLFEDLGVTPETTEVGPLKRVSAESIDIYVGDIFDLTRDILGPVNAIYDRAALVAFPAKMRLPYAAHLAAITNMAPQLVITFQYDQSLMDGPPFSVVEDEIRSLYSTIYRLERLTHEDVEGGLKGHHATEEVWHLNV